MQATGETGAVQLHAKPRLELTVALDLVHPDGFDQPTIQLLELATIDILPRLVVEMIGDLGLLRRRPALAIHRHRLGPILRVNAQLSVCMSLACSLRLSRAGSS